MALTPKLLAKGELFSGSQSKEELESQTYKVCILKRDKTCLIKKIIIAQFKAYYRFNFIPDSPIYLIWASSWSWHQDLGYWVKEDLQHNVHSNISDTEQHAKFVDGKIDFLKQNSETSDRQFHMFYKTKDSPEDSSGLLIVYKADNYHSVEPLVVEGGDALWLHIFPSFMTTENGTENEVPFSLEKDSAICIPLNLTNRGTDIKEVIWVYKGSGFQYLIFGAELD